MEESELFTDCRVGFMVPGTINPYIVLLSGMGRSGLPFRSVQKNLLRTKIKFADSFICISIIIRRNLIVCSSTDPPYL